MFRAANDALTSAAADEFIGLPKMFTIMNAAAVAALEARRDG